MSGQTSLEAIGGDLASKLDQLQKELLEAEDNLIVLQKLAHSKSEMTANINNVNKVDDDADHDVELSEAGTSQSAYVVKDEVFEAVNDGQYDDHAEQEDNFEPEQVCSDLTIWLSLNCFTFSRTLSISKHRRTYS